ncbi:hypothetical protein BDN72DRAFT_868829 [Pluteus cervinus]|uniref:Uncharacterized protein n=1 Tax=Pluteus cervinus TaxID=181527 RepID=A0ACD3B828_9AGAR|nr:hypothetical protein BDN72DRAFT_868829 [Pluteus cervinus]
MSDPVPATGLAGRRKGPKTLPKLPLSAFSPPPTGVAESFGLAASPSTIHPETVVDSHVLLTGSKSLDQWKQEAGGSFVGRVTGVVANAHGSDLSKVIADLESVGESPQIISLAVPFELNGPEPTIPSTKIPISFVTTFNGPAPEGVTRLRGVLEKGRPVEIIVEDLANEGNLEALEELLAKSTADLSNLPPIVLSNFVPPPQDSDLPSHKLMNHPAYQAFQTQTTALSLYADVSVKFLPPSWVLADGGETEDPAKSKREWKRRIKMYLAPIIEAFGFERILFGSSPAPATKSPLAENWYELARESLAELGIEQEFINAVFSDNAKRFYSL